MRTERDQFSQLVAEAQARALTQQQYVRAFRQSLLIRLTSERRVGITQRPQRACRRPSPICTSSWLGSASRCRPLVHPPYDCALMLLVAHRRQRTWRSSTAKWHALRPLLPPLQLWQLLRWIQHN